LRRANAALAGFEGRGDAVGQADAVRAIVNSMVSLGQVGEAAAAAKEGLTSIRRSGERSLEVLRRREAPLILATAEVQLEARELDAAVASATKAQGFFRGVNEQRGSAEAQLVPARAHLLRGDAADAVAAAEAAAALFRGLGDGPGEGAARQLAVEAHFLAGGYADTVRAVEGARAVFSDLDDKAGMGRMFRWAARAHLKNNQPEDALGSARMAMQHFSEAGCRKDYGEAAMWAARAHHSQQEYNHAIIMAKQALSEFAKVEDRKARADAENEVSQMLMDAGKIDDAKRHAEAAHAIYKELQDIKGKKEANEMLCTLELAPDAIELRQGKARSLIRKLVRAVSSRDPQAFKEAARDLQRAEYKGMFTIGDVKTALEALMAEDSAGTIRFVRSNAGSWSELSEIEAPKSTGLKDWTLRFFEDK